MKKDTPLIGERKKTIRVAVPPKKATQVLREHHEVLRDIIDRLLRTSRDEVDRRRALCDELHRELLIHERIEEDIFYPEISDVHPTVDVSWSEHRQMTDQLGALLRADPRTGRFEEELRLMHDVLEAHARFDEEQDMFPEVERLMDEARLVEIGDRLQEQQQRMRSSKLMKARHWLERVALRWMRMPLRAPGRASGRGRTPR